MKTCESRQKYNYQNLQLTEEICFVSIDGPFRMELYDSLLVDLADEVENMHARDLCVIHESDMAHSNSSCENMATIEKKRKMLPRVNDGFRFRKYGRKVIGNQVRHYYRCSLEGCTVRRHVTM